MSDNPYEAPQAEIVAVGVKSGKSEDVRAVAVAQKGILICILINFLAIGAQFAVKSQGGDVAALQPLFGAAMLIAGLVGLIFVFRLATKVYSTGVGILLGLLSVIPLFGLIVLLSVNGKATRILRENGHKVGFLGANLGEF
jgi:hypothetical protein